MDKNEIINKVAEIKEQMREMVDLAEQENRSLTDDEKTRFSELQNEINEENKKLSAADIQERQTIVPEIAEEKENIKLNTRKMNSLKEQLAAEIQAIANSRSVEDFANVQGNTINLRAEGEEQTKEAQIANIQSEYRTDILEPLENAILFNKLGIKVINTEKAVKVPSVNNVECSIEGETTELVGQKINFNKTSVNPFRVGVSMPFSGAAIREADIDLVSYAIDLAGKAEGRLINALVLNQDGVTDAASTVHKGPFVDKLDPSTAKKLTWQNMVALETAVKAKNVDINETAAYVISPATEGYLKSAPVAKKDAGSGRFVIEDGKINGYPYLVSQQLVKIDASENVTDYVGFGVFDNFMIQRVGAPTLVVDNLSRSKEDITEVNLNDRLAIHTLRPDAFAAFVIDASLA